MSNMLDQMEKDGEKARALKLMQERIATATPTEPSATAGEQAIQNDDQAVFAFSAMAAAQ